MKHVFVAAALLAASIAGAPAQTFPDRPIKVMVPYPAGGPTDTVARAITRASPPISGRAWSSRTRPAPAAVSR